MKKIKKGYKTGTEVHGRKKPTTFDWGDEKLAKGKKLYIKGPGGKFIPVPIKMVGSKKIAKKGGKV